MKNIGYRSTKIIAVKREISQSIKSPKRHRNRSRLNAFRKEISVGNTSSIASKMEKLMIKQLTYQVIILHVK
jgi:hypothetical protein